MPGARRAARRGDGSDGLSLRISAILVAVGGSLNAKVIHGSGVPASEVRELPPFDSVELSGSNDVSIHVGSEQSVVVHADDNLLDRVATSVDGRRLVVGNERGGGTVVTTETPLRVEVTMPTLDDVTLSGSGLIGAAGIDAEIFTVTISGSGVVNASGRTHALVVTLGGSGDAQLQDLAARDLRARMSGSGRILVNATEKIDASVSGTGSIVYTGDPEHVSSKVTGVGTVNRR